MGVYDLPRPTPDRELALDAAAALAISVAICTMSHTLVFMTVLVPAVLVARCLAWRHLSPAHKQRWVGELLFFAICTLLGGFNDWNTVVRCGVYDYTAPCFFPHISTIPMWMLAYWGMILRSIATLSTWHRLQPPAAVRNDVHLGPYVWHSAWLRVGVLLVLVEITRQLIFVHFADPLWSWLPFALAAVVHAAVCRPDRRDVLLAASFLLFGPIVEIAYIQIGGLHRYQLGWLGGVPLWIALWWVLGVQIWADLAPRLQALCERLVSGSPNTQTI